MTAKVLECDHLFYPHSNIFRVPSYSHQNLGEPTVIMETGVRNRLRRNSRAILSEFQIKNIRACKWYILAAAGRGRWVREIEESMPFVSTHVVKNEWVSFRKREEQLRV